MSDTWDERGFAEALILGDEEALQAFAGRFRFRLEKARLEASKVWPETADASGDFGLQTGDSGLLTGDFGLQTGDFFIRRVARSVSRRYLSLLEAGDAERGSPFESILHRLNLPDLFLVSLMESGSEEGWRAFHLSYDKDLSSTVRGFVKNPLLTSEILEDLDGDLFAAGRKGGGLLRTYDGIGPLGGWLRTVIYRRVLAFSRKRSRAPRSLSAGDPDRGVRDPGRGGDALPPDIVEIFQKAVRKAFSSLHSSDRVLLLLRYMKGVTQKKLALMRNWSEAKVSRRIRSLRRSLLRDIRRGTGLSEKEFRQCLPTVRASLGRLVDESFCEKMDFSDISSSAEPRESGGHGNKTAPAETENA